jgi:phosphoserine phosphatase
MSYVLTLVSSSPQSPVNKKHIREIGKIIGFYNEQFTAEPVWLAPKKAVDLGIIQKPQSAMMAHIREFLAESRIDLFTQPIERRRKKLLLADMDSTIVSTETLDELAEYAGIKEQIAAITALAMDGKLDFHAALRERVGLLKGLSANKLTETLNKTEINPGAEILVKIMRDNGAICALVSGGFTFFTKAIADQLGFHNHHGNELEIENNILTGKVLEPIQDKFSKLDHMRRYCLDLNIKEENVMAIGDGANDIPMLKTAGLGMGYHPKAAVINEIDNLILYGDLSAALYAQGYTSQQIGNIS